MTEHSHEVRAKVWTLHNVAGRSYTVIGEMLDMTRGQVGSIERTWGRKVDEALRVVRAMGWVVVRDGKDNIGSADDLP